VAFCGGLGVPFFRRQAKSCHNGILWKILTGIGEMPGVIDEHLTKLGGD